MGKREKSLILFGYNLLHYIVLLHYSGVGICFGTG